MAFDKIVGVDGTTYQFPSLVRNRIAANIELVGSAENLATIAALGPALSGKASTSHNHALSSLESNGIDELGDVAIGFDGGAGIALQDKHTLQYEASTSKWRNKVASGGVTVSDAPPSTPILGDAWFDSNDGTLYVYYSDGNTVQWVQVQANSALESSILSRLTSIESYVNTAQDTPQYSPNYIINGGMEVWQRGTSFAPITNASYSADRWQAQSSLVPTSRTIQQLALDGAITELGQIGYYLRSTVNTIGSGTNIRMRHSLEDVESLAGKTVTLSWYGKHNIAGSLRVLVGQQFGTGGSAGINISDTTAAYTTSWQRFSVTFDVPSVAGKTITSDSHLRIEFFQQDVTGSALDITGVQLEEGSVATPFRRAGLTFQGELAACQRYYYRNSATATGSQLGHGWGSGTTSAVISVNFPVSMRTTPTAIDYSGLQLGNNIDGGLGAVTAASIMSSQCNTDNGMVSITASSLGMRNAYWLQSSSASSYIGFTAEF